MTASTNLQEHAPLIDRFGRRISYLRLSVTDRCNLRCTYCMAEQMDFLPRAELLTFDELELVARTFVERGVKKIRVTGGEPLVRKGIEELFGALGKMRGSGLEQIAVTTNGIMLKSMAGMLASNGVTSVNVSLDTLDRGKFRDIARRDELPAVLQGLQAAARAGLSVKINTVALKATNDEELPHLVEWAHANGFAISLIEVMPLGETGVERFDQFFPLTEVKERLDARWNLDEEVERTPNSGPSRYYRIRETGGRVGFISPLTNNFCAGCNRVRLTCTGRIYMCLGQEDHIDLREIVRRGGGSSEIGQALDAAMQAKPEKHEFVIGPGRASVGLDRHMSLTGG